MQRHLPSGIAAALTILTVGFTPACKDDKGESTDQAQKQPANQPAEDGAIAAPEAEAGSEVEAPPTGEGGEAAPASASGAEGEVAVPEAEAETGAAAPEAEEDPVPALYEQAKSLDTADDAAKQALEDALAAGGSKIDAAKLANERGEALMKKGEGERAEQFFAWAAKTHSLYAEPVYNLATLAAYAGDLDIAKDHLQELQKRGNKKLMKKVGVDPAFAPLHDDPDVRKIYEQ